MVWETILETCYKGYLLPTCFVQSFYFINIFIVHVLLVFLILIYCAETRAKVVEREDLDSDDENAEEQRFGNKRMQSLEGMGASYKGKIVSRKDITSDGEVCSSDTDESIKDLSQNDISRRFSDESEGEISHILNGMRRYV